MDPTTRNAINHLKIHGANVAVASLLDSVLDNSRTKITDAGRISSAMCFIGGCDYADRKARAEAREKAELVDLESFNAGSWCAANAMSVTNHGLLHWYTEEGQKQLAKMKKSDIRKVLKP